MNDEKNLQALTNQPVTISIGGKEYTARRATLLDLGLSADYQKKLEEGGQTISSGMFTGAWLLVRLMKQWHPELTVEGLLDLMDPTKPEELSNALGKVGFLAKTPPATKDSTQASQAGGDSTQ